MGFKQFFNENDLKVAKEIKRQIGHKALVMLGAHSFVGSKNSLQFRIKGSKNVNFIEITLTPADLYDIRYGKIRGLNYKDVSKELGVFVDQLHTSIERNTGLYTSL